MRGNADDTAREMKSAETTTSSLDSGFRCSSSTCMHAHQVKEESERGLLSG